MTETRRTVAAALLVAALALILAAFAPAFFVKDDFQLEFLPASKEIADAWRSGELPLLSRNSWLCAGLAAEYQFGVFSIFRMLVEGIAWLLPLSLIARGTLLFIVHAAVAAAGGYLLARSYGARPAAAALVALIAGLNGWMLWWGTTWYAIAAGFAWLPWYWLALRGVEQGRRRSAIGTALSLYLLITAGAPYVVAMAVAVAAMHIITKLVQRRWRESLTMIGASALGLALAAPAVLMLLEYWPYTARRNVATALESLWFLPPAAWFGAIVPSFSVDWAVFAGRLPHSAVELLGAFIPLVAILAAWRRDFVRRHAPELLMLAVLLALILLPSAGPLRWSFRWLPLFHLVLAIVGAVALDSPRRRIPPFALGALGVTVLASFALDHAARTTLLHAGVIAALCILWWFFEKSWMPVVITIAMIALTFGAYSRQGETPAFAYDDALLSPAPLDPSRRYLAMYGVEDIMGRDARGRVTRGIGATARPGNVPMLAGLDFINGYSPLGMEALRNIFGVEVHGPMKPDHARGLLTRESGRNQLLQHAGVDGLLVPEGLTRAHAPLLFANGWRPVTRIGEIIVLHRDEISDPLFAAALAIKTNDVQQAYDAIFQRRTPQLPVVLLTPGRSGAERYGRRAFSDLVDARNHTSFLVRDRGPKALVVFRRAWMPGWRATLSGRPLPVLRANMIMPAVEIPENATGELRLFYRPRSLVIGAWIAGAALLVIALMWRRG